MEDYQILICAQAAHNTYAAYSRAVGQDIKDWPDAPDWQRQDTIKLVKAVLEGHHSARAEHQRWFDNKLANGYQYGPERNDDPAKGPLTNPSMVDYDALPVFQLMKDPLVLCAVIGTAAHLGIWTGKVPELV